MYTRINLNEDLSTYCRQHPQHRWLSSMRVVACSPLQAVDLSSTELLIPNRNCHVHQALVCSFGGLKPLKMLATNLDDELIITPDSYRGSLKFFGQGC